MFSAVSGLRNHQTRMDVIGNNIANVNTTAFKSSRVTFQDIYSQTLKAASAPGTTTGGMNPIQVGLGTTLSSIDVLHIRSSAQRTDRPLDLCIAGDGFFVVSDGANRYYTRVGNFSFDVQGNLLGPGGYRVLGTNCTVDDTQTPPVVVAPDDPNGTNLENIKIENLTSYSDISIDKNGTINAIDASGNRVQLAKIALARVPNPEGLLQIGGGLFQETVNSGTLQSGEIAIGIPGDNGTGLIDAGALEMSNVDLSKEFTDMIITQRGFQANSRVITTSDEMLQELVNLKR